MDVTTARERLEDMLAELDRSIGVLQGDPVAIREYSAADAGSDLTDADRARAMLTVATTQRRAVIDAIKRLDEGTYGRCVDCRGLVPEDGISWQGHLFGAIGGILAAWLVSLANRTTRSASSTPASAA